MEETLSSLLARMPRPGAAHAVRIACELLDAAKRGDLVARLPAGATGAEYGAPETALGETVDQRADVYAVGVVLYEMLAGRRPFDGKTRNELVSAHLLRQPPPLRELAPDVDDELAAVVRKAMAKKREERFQSVDEMKAALEAAGGAGSGTEAGTAAAAGTGEAAAVSGSDADDRFTRKMDAPSPPAPSPAPAPPAAPAPSAPRRPPAALGYAVGGAFLLGLLLWLALRPTAPSRTLTSLSPERTATLEAALQRSDLPAARAEAERLAKAYPRDARTFALLGDVLFGQGEKERALAAYREALRLDPSIGTAPELLANLRATFNDPQHGEAAFRLAETIGPPAQPILSDLAADTHDARLKRRAAEAIGRIRQGEAPR